MSSLPYLSVVTLAVRNAERSATFLETVFGCSRRAPLREGMAYLETQGLLIAVCERQLLARHLGLDVPTSDATPRGGSVISFQVDTANEVDDAVHRATSTGARALRPIHTPEWGGRAAALQDDDGHVYEIVFNPRWDARDRHARSNV